MELKYNRVLLKLSGEVLAGEKKFGVDVETVGKLCDKIGSKINVYEYYDFLNEEDLKEIFKRSRIFMLETDYFGLTETTFLIDYEFYRGLKNTKMITQNL